MLAKIVINKSLANIKKHLLLPLLLISLNKNKEMKKTVVFIMLIALFNVANAQNSAEKIIAGNSGLHIGGYAQVDFNLESRDGTIHKNGTLDVHRLVTFFIS